MSQRRIIVAVTIVVLLLFVPAIRGYQGGVYNRAYGCNCHSQAGSTAASVGISGLPASYDAGDSYQLTVSVTGGVSGSGGGFSLEVNKGTLSAGVGQTLVKVNNQGNSATHTMTGNSYRSWSFDWTAPSQNAGLVTFEVAGMTSNGNGGTSGDRWATSMVQIPENIPANNPPSVTNVLLSPNNAVTTDTLTLSYSFSDPDNDQESGSEITWYRDSQALPQGTVVGLSVPSGQTAKGQEWYATVKPSDGNDYGSIVSSNTVTITNSPPTLTTPTITPSSAEETDNLTVAYSASDDDQDILTTEIRWYLDGAIVAEFNDDTTIPSIATRQGDEWRVEVTVSDNDETVTASSQIMTVGEIINANNPPEIPTIDISPSQPVTGDDLQLTYTIQDPENDAIVATQIEWLVDGIPAIYDSVIISSTETAKGQVWEAKVRVNDGKDWSSWYQQTVSIGNTPPIVESLTVSPIEVYTSDDILAEYTFSDADGDVLENPLITWSKNGIIQAEFDGVNPLPAQYTAKGETWVVSVKANDGESFSQANSEIVVVVQNSLPVLTIDEIPNNLTFVNTELTQLAINPLFTDADNDLVDSTIYWLRNGFREGTLDNATIVPAAYFGAGQTWTLTISYHDNDAPPQQFSHTLVIDNLEPTASIEVLSTNLWDGEIILVDGSKSIDNDGIVVNYLWEYQDSNGNSVSLTGEQIELIGSGTIGIILTVEDDLGLTATTTRVIQTSQGPSASGLFALNEPAGVKLTWQWSGDSAEFTILRNGEEVGVTSELTFTDKPVMAGPTSYTVSPVIDNQTLIAGSTSIVDFDVAISVDSTSSVSDTGGFVLGVMLLIISIGVISLGLLQRRESDE